LGHQSSGVKSNSQQKKINSRNIIVITAFSFALFRLLTQGATLSKNTGAETFLLFMSFEFSDLSYFPVVLAFRSFLLSGRFLFPVLLGIHYTVFVAFKFWAFMVAAVIFGNSGSFQYKIHIVGAAFCLMFKNSPIHLAVFTYRTQKYNELKKTEKLEVQQTLITMVRESDTASFIVIV
jgi:hypothetical protein